MNTPSTDLSIAVIIPCFNEALAIGQVLKSFQTTLPQAALHVFDNNSTDGTAQVASTCGASVTHVQLRGKGNVVRRMFADVDADIYIMVDGDATYDISDIREHIALLVHKKLDMLVGCRQDSGNNPLTYRPGHRWGNRLLTGSVSRIFGGTFSDMLSGYRIFSKRYVKSFPAISKGFEIETELTVHALGLRMPYTEVPTTYLSRPQGSESKLSTYRDGYRILRTILKLFISERPLAFFTIVAGILAALSITLAVPLAITYMQTGLVPRLPTAVLVTGGMLSALLSLVCGAVLDTVTQGRQELKHLAYLRIPAISCTTHP
jgi:glycosyltransferase involved in cell wall biosynthesis